MQAGKLRIVQKRDDKGDDSPRDGAVSSPTPPAPSSHENGNGAGVDDWLGRVEAQKAAAETKAGIELRLCEVRVLLNGRQFEPAIRELEKLTAEYPEYEIGELLSRARQDQARDASVLRALEEVGWLTGRDRIDLAVQFMRETAGDLSDDARFASQLEKLEAALPEWERRRSIEECLRQAEALEQRGQWTVALRLLEESVTVNPASGELLDAVERAQRRLREQEGRKRFASRLEAIARRIAARDWRQALALVEAARTEFPGAAELEPLEKTAREALRLAQYEDIVSEVRQYLAEGDTAEAARTLRDALNADSNNPALTALLAEVEKEERYRTELQKAQTLFGRRKFSQAEFILIELAESGRPEATALLELIAEWRVANEEEGFYKGGVDKVSKLIQDGHLDQAADLLENIVTLFPNDPILERQLRSIRRGGGPDQMKPAALPPAAPPPKPEPELNATATEPETPANDPGAAPPVERRRFGWPAAAICGALVILGAIMIWQYTSGRTAKASRPSPFQAPVAAAPKATHNPIEAAPAGNSSAADHPPASSSGPASAAQRTAAGSSGAAPDKAAAPRRAFQAPPPGRQGQSWDPSTAPAPPAVTRNPGDTSLPEVIASARPSIPVPQPAAAPPPQRSDLRPATPISTPAPALPKLASEHGMYGAVTLEATIARDGNVRAVKVLGGNPLLAEAARQAVMRWRYRPATLNGQPIESTREIKVAFEGQKSVPR
jgi:protein TonB